MSRSNDFEGHGLHVGGTDIDPARRCDARPERRPARGFGFVMAALLLSALISYKKPLGLRAMETPYFNGERTRTKRLTK